MAEKGERPRERSSDILGLARLLADQQDLSEIGSRLVRTELEGLVAQRLGDIGPISWTDAWVDKGGWGTDVWQNAWASDFWDDALGGRGRPVARPRGPDDFIELKTGDQQVAPEEVFSSEEIEVLQQLEILRA
jgi:hypothetical protein